MSKWQDPRPPVWQGYVKGKLVTIYDMDAYEESAQLYPDDPNQEKVTVKKENTVPFAKKKPQARYNWIVKPDKPLGNVS